MDSEREDQDVKGECVKRVGRRGQRLLGGEGGNTSTVRDTEVHKIEQEQEQGRCQRREIV